MTGSSPMYSRLKGAGALTKCPDAITSTTVGVVPSTKPESPPPGAKNSCSDAFSGTRSPPKLTAPRAEPTGPACDPFGHPDGPILSSVVTEQVANPCGRSEERRVG